MAIIKSLQTIKAGGGMKKRKCSCPVGGNVNWYSHYIYIHNGIWAMQKECIRVSSSEVDELRAFIQWSQSEREIQISSINPYIWNLGKNGTHEPIFWAGIETQP